jgi:hypothetical protein
MSKRSTTFALVLALFGLALAAGCGGPAGSEKSRESRSAVIGSGTNISSSWPNGCYSDHQDCTDQGLVYCCDAGWNCQCAEQPPPDGQGNGSCANPSCVMRPQG